MSYKQNLHTHCTHCDGRDTPEEMIAYARQKGLGVAVMGPVGGGRLAAPTELSQRLGIGRATLYRAFEMLERGGMICREGKTIRILDETQLHALCEHA